MWDKYPDGWGSSASDKGCCWTSPWGWLDLPCAWWEPLKAFPKGCVLLAPWMPEGLAQYNRIHAFSLIYLKPLQIMRILLWGCCFFITAYNRLLFSWDIHPHGHTEECVSVAACPLWETETLCFFHLVPLLIHRTEENLENTATSSPWLNTFPAQQGFICECEILAIMHLSWIKWAFLWNLDKAEDHLTYFRLLFPHVSPGNEPFFLLAGGTMVPKMSVWGWGHCPISLPTAAVSSAQAYRRCYFGRHHDPAQIGKHLF